jgi:rubrerythrin
MGIYFNADEIFEIAEQIERNGAKFYRYAAQRAEDAATRQRLVKLADWELSHEKTFAAMRAELSDQERQPTAYDPDNQAVMYLRAMADSRVFDVKADPTKLLTGKETLADILQIALGLEKDSIAFYLGMKEIIPERLGKDRIDSIIKEEMNHITLLIEELKAKGGRS